METNLYLTNLYILGKILDSQKKIKLLMDFFSPLKTSDAGSNISCKISSKILASIVNYCYINFNKIQFIYNIKYFKVC